MSYCPVFYDQHFKERAKPSTPGLNVRHLHYIATRPGAVYNKGCGFGLWGRLPEDNSIRTQTDLERAKQIVREASADHTLYRAILSVSGQDASIYGLYDRERWEKLLRDHISCIAREMDIKPENFCWCASMHRERNHPHIHILYWDNGDQPRPEFIPKPRFVAMTERIRAEFSGDIHREEIRELQQEQRDQLKSLRTLLQSMCQEACPEEALNVSKLYRSKALDSITDRLLDLLRTMPDRGSLRYAYLPPAYKKKVDELINTCLKMPDLEKVLAQYETLTRRIGKLYANEDSTIDANVDKAKSKLRKDLGNEIMNVVKELQAEVEIIAPGNQTEVQALVRDTVPQILPTLESYHRLRIQLPKERIPVSCMAKQIPNYQEQLKKLVSELASDARLRLPLQKYALEAAQALVVDAGNAPHTGDPARLPKKHNVLGHFLNDQQWEVYKQVYQEARQDIRNMVMQQLREDAGWTHEALRTSAVKLLCGMMRIASQSAHQRQAVAAQVRRNSRNRTKDKSREARKDARAEQQTPGDWGDDY